MVQRTLLAVLAVLALLVGSREVRSQAPARAPAGQRPPLRVAQAPARRQTAPAAAPAVPQAPFQLTPQEDAELQQLLVDWQNAGKNVKTFKCTFTLYQYDKTFGPKKPTKENPNGAWREGQGQLKYSKPDRGMFQVETVKTWSAEKNEWGAAEPGEHWVCDGKSLYELDARQSEMRVRPLPAHLQGQGIANGPLPFLFGADAQQLQQRFWMRIITPPAAANTQIWLQAYPRWAQDAANYQRAELILSRGELKPIALRVVQLNDSPWTYQFNAIKTNDIWATIKRDFAAPLTPLGWKKVVIDPGQPGPGAPPAQAQLPASGQKR
ncbi:MAG: hypothetical protein U0836_15490 [Pirellulales bacterium]